LYRYFIFFTRHYKISHTHTHTQGSKTTFWYKQFFFIYRAEPYKWLMLKRCTEINKCRLHKNAEYYFKRSLVLSLNVLDVPNAHLRRERCLKILFVPNSQHTSYLYKNQSHNVVQRNSFSLFWNLFNICICIYIYAICGQNIEPWTLKLLVRVVTITSSYLLITSFTVEDKFQ
jgi:hypothetical protein